MNWIQVNMGSFLEERKQRFNPQDKEISGLQRIEKIDFSGKIYLSDKPSRTKMILIKNNDLVISGINVSKGAMNVYYGEKDILATIHYSSYVYDKKKIDIHFLQYFLKSAEFKLLLKNQIPGGIKTEIKPKHLLPLKVFIPSKIEDQRKIAINLNHQTLKIQSLKDSINYQNQLLSKLKQSILQDAIKGKLTKDWRQENSNTEPASKLLELIKSEKAQLIADKKLKKGMKTKQPKSLIDEESFPSSWVKCKSDDILFTTKLAGFEYSKYVSLKDVEEIPVIRAQNVRNLQIDKTKLLYIDRKTSLILNRCSLVKKCLLVTFIGAGIGDVATFNEKERWHLAPNVAKMEPFENCEELINIKFLNYYLISPIGRKEIFKHIKETAQPSLSMNTIRDIDFLIPPIEEQEIIVKKVDLLMQKCDQLKKEIKKSESNAEMLIQSVLKEAFNNQ